ncbi:MAG: superoxide dismutase [Rickettsiaceae bacterium H1]|nr:superoxide dismutase [Rickettsiaceae bacterium H1]
MKFALPDLPYEKNALEPFISAKTLDFHHSKHHSAYVNNLNKLIENSNLVNMPLEDIIKNTNNDNSKAGIFNNAAQAWNHTFYWNSMKPGGGDQPKDKLMQKINEDFGKFDNFVNEFKTAGATQFGSGWAWLVLENGKLKVVKTANAICPIVSGQIPLITMDVWEHAYYLDFQNRRPDYIAMFLDKLINWDFAAENFNKAI